MFKLYLLIAQWVRVQSSSNRIVNYKDKQELAPGKNNVRAAYLKDRLEFKFL